jgi:hypothetical protein
MKFFKDNSYDIVRLFINQCGITIFALVLYFPFGTFEDKAFGANMQTAVSVLATAFYLFLLYSAAWEFGSVDRMRSDSGKISLNRFKGTIMSLVANIPNFLIAGGALVSILIAGSTQSDVAYTVFGILNTLMRFLSAMYIGVLRGLFDFLSSDNVAYLTSQTIGYLVLPLLSVIVVSIGYVVGTHQFKVFASKKKYD